MLENIFSKYKFKQLNEFLEKIKLEIIDENTKIDYLELDTDWVEINTNLKNGLDLKILIAKNTDMDSIAFYFKKGFITLEQMNFIIINDNERTYNRVIKHDYFTVNGDIATTFNSGYIFINNDYISGWEKIRKLNFKHINHYAGRDNLANFSCHIDNSKNEVLYIENNDVAEEKTITSIMASNSEKTYTKVLTKLNK